MIKERLCAINKNNVWVDDTLKGEEIVFKKVYFRFWEEMQIK